MNRGLNQSKQEAFDFWMPEKLVFGKEDIEKFQKIMDRKSIEYTRETSIINLAKVWTQKFLLLPSKKMLTSHPQGSTVSAKYNCDKGPEEIISIKAQKLSTAREEKGCFDGNAEACTDPQICNRATVRKNEKQEWDTSEKYKPYVQEAKSRGLKCRVEQSTSSSKLDKAKSTCAEIGFTAGTENYGKCVLKMMDN